MNKLIDCHECCVCTAGNTICPVVYNDFSFTPATVEEIVRRLDLNEFEDDRAYMIDYLKHHYGHQYKEDPETMSKAKMLGMQTKYIPNAKADERRPRKLPLKKIPKEDPKPKTKKKPVEPKYPSCNFNEGVVCKSCGLNGNRGHIVPPCEICGWNPDVRKARNAKLGINPASTS